MILIVGLHHQALATPPLDELERPGPDGAAVEFCGVEVGALEQVLRHDAGARVDEHGQERARGVPKPEAHSVVVDDLDRTHGELLRPLRILLGGQLGEADERVEVGAMGRGHLRIEDRIEREGDVARGERLAVVPLHTALELERVREPVARHLPRLGQERLHVEALIELDEAVEERPLGDVRLAVGGDDRVQRRGIPAEPDDEVLAGGEARRGRQADERDEQHE